MARPSKNNADYFGHDHDMRNHRKIKAIRTRFGLPGYAMWVMFLEVLTESEDNRFIDNDLEIELLAGDFGVSVTEIRELIDFCIKLELLFAENGGVFSKTLDSRLKTVYEKRNLARKSYEKQSKSRVSTTNEGVSVTETTQSKGKVNESKEKESTNVDEKKEEELPPLSIADQVEDFKQREAERLEAEKKRAKALRSPPPPTLDEAAEIFRHSDSLLENAMKVYKLTKQEYFQAIERFISDQKADDCEVISESDVRTHFRRWLKYYKDLPGVAPELSSSPGKIQGALEVLAQVGASIRADRAHQNI
jgi:DNA-binding HxlR family transcriptional regulator